MSAKKIGGLGRGFDSLIPTELIDESLDPTAEQDEKVSVFRELDIEKIVPNPDQPRRQFDEESLEEISRSIAEHGIIQPIVVTPVGDSYQIVAGERRYRGAKKAGLKKIPSLVRTLTDQHQLELSLIENLQRRDLNVLETATAYLKLRDQFSMSLEEVGKRAGKSVSAISNTLRLLRLPENVRQALQDGRLREGQARPLVGVDPVVVDAVLPQILREEWSARKIEQFIVNHKKALKQASVQSASAPHHEKTIERLSERFATPIKVRSNTKGAGQILISFSNDEEFNRITRILSE